MEQKEEIIDLRHQLTWRNSIRFPIQSKASRKDIFIGGLWLLIPIIGWLINMGHRVRIVHRLQKGETPWPAWEHPLELFKHGLLTFLGMVWYGWPGISLMLLGYWYTSLPLGILGFSLWLLAVIAIPGYMSHYCKQYAPQEIFNPFLALSRVYQGGAAYWKAWSIVLPAMFLSFLGLLGLGVGFLFTTVWFWQIAAFSFATVFTQRFSLDTPKQVEQKKHFKIIRDSGRSIKNELGYDHRKFHESKFFPARKPDSMAKPFVLTKDFQDKNIPLLYYDKEGPFVHADYFSDLRVQDLNRIHKKDQALIGTVKKDLPFETLIRFLIETDIIETFIHISSEMIVQITNHHQAEVRGTHTYYTNEKNVASFAFTILWNEKNELLIIPI
ncbi:MAG: hypothetical protein MK212_14215 [Saprospiraceae bacterium]|nr:hypothetical protein [Saprospiraceae bacterium]